MSSSSDDTRLRSSKVINSSPPARPPGSCQAQEGQGLSAPWSDTSRHGVTGETVPFPPVLLTLSEVYLRAAELIKVGIFHPETVPYNPLQNSDGA